VSLDTGPELVRVKVSARTRFGAVRVKVEVPAGTCRLGNLLPVLRTIDDALVADACRASEAQGRQVTCRAGCGACCRQLVGVMPCEASWLMALVESLPAVRRRAVRSRFVDAAGAVREAGLRDQVAHAPLLTRPDLRELAARYFRLGVPCPFLKDEGCSIYPHRPLVCREYLVASSPQECRTLGHVERVPVPGQLSSRIGRDKGSEAAWVPLVLAPEWVAEHPEACHVGDRYTGPELLARALGAHAVHETPEVVVQNAR
jgi:Fe-S-cluster containining protein